MHSRMAKIVLVFAFASAVNAGIGCSINFTFHNVHLGLLSSLRNECVAVPNDLCAVVYDDGGCRGWKLDINEGEIMFKWWDPIYYWYRNDIEAVSVKAGCTFTGFDDSSLNGRSMTIRAGNKDRHVTLNDEDDFEDFDEEIQSISCTCRR